jgi:transcriptional regulator with XRE-family HTH domain
VNIFKDLWRKLSGSKEYREEFVAAQVKRGIPFQIRALLENEGWSQQDLAERANLTQGVISRAMNPNYGNLTLNTLIRIAAGFDVAFIGQFVPFSDLGRWFVNLSEAAQVPSFEEENAIVETVGITALPGYSASMFLGMKKVKKPQPVATPQKDKLHADLQGGATKNRIESQVSTNAPQAIPEALKIAMAGGQR